VFLEPPQGLLLGDDREDLNFSRDDVMEDAQLTHPEPKLGASKTA
jgi:hypothetical protein